MMEITNLMKNTIVLLMTIVVGGAGALLERVQICNLPEVVKRGRADIRAPRGSNPLPLHHLCHLQPSRHP
jgi:hypothetical protein